MDVLKKIRHAGFTLALIDGFIEVSPADQLNQHQRQFLKAHRAEIISELQEEQKIIDWLASIGETDHEIIEDTLNRCRADSEAREYFLSRAGATRVQLGCNSGATRVQLWCSNQPQDQMK